MYRERVGEIHRKRGFAGTKPKIAAKTRDRTGPKRNPIAISVFIPGFSDVP